MKRTITSVAIGAIVTMAGISTAHAWGFGDVFSDKSTKTTNVTQSAGGDARYQSQGKNSGGRDRWEIKNSLNRTNSVEISRAKNINTGTVNSGGNSQGEVRDQGNGSAKNSRVAGDWRNEGAIGHSMVTGGMSNGDTIMTGNTYMGTDAMDSQNEAARIQAKKEVDLKTLETSRTRSLYVK